MSTDDRDLMSAVRQMQILAGALIAAVTTFGGIALAVGGLPVAANGLPMISTVGAAFTALQIILVLVLPPILRQRAIQSSASGDAWVAAYRSGMMFAFALLEGAAFFNLVAYITEKQWWSLAIVGGLLLMMLARFPTYSKLSQWIETQRAFRD